MKKVKAILSLLICCMFLIGTVTNAMASCCSEVADQAVSMPCHDTESEKKQSNIDCENCDCQHCTQINAVFQERVIETFGVSGIEFNVVQNIHSYHTEDVFQPPRHIS